MKQTLILQTAHLLLKHHLSTNDVVIDATVGNGYDTLFLSDIVSHIYAFDIQQKAIATTAQLIHDRNLSNVTLIHASHEDFHLYVKDFKAVIFNLGYLPHGDKTISTHAESTLKTLQSMLVLLPLGGFIQLVVYTGHDEGKHESDSIDAYLKSLSTTHFKVMRIELPYQDNHPPHILMIHKIKDGSH